jgi:hypothetical protein
VEHWPAADNPDPAQHQMKQPLGADAGPGLSFSMDRIAMNIHGNADTHVDALCHIVCVRVGHRRRRIEQGPWDAAGARAGLHPALLPVLAERQIAALGSDGNNDAAPSAVAGVDFPVHVLAVNALGLHLLDYLQFTELAQACAAAGRWSFLCVIAPLRLPTGTGSPVNPIAIL